MYIDILPNPSIYVNIYVMNECCPPLFGETLSRTDAEELAAKLKAIADPSRLRLLHLIAANGDACACDLTGPLGLSQPTVSHHLKVLTEAGFLEREKRSKWAHYRVKGDTMRELAAALGVSASV